MGQGPTESVGGVPDKRGFKAPEQRVLPQAEEYRSFTFLLSRNCSPGGRIVVWQGPVQTEQSRCQAKWIAPKTTALDSRNALLN